MITRFGRFSGNACTPWARWLCRVGLVLGLLALLAILLPGPLYRFGALGLGPAFSLMGKGAAAGIVAAIVAAIALLMALLAHRGRYILYAVLGISLGLLAFVPPWMFKHKAGSVPPIHDISTDTTQPPAFRAVLDERVNSPNSPAYGGAEVAAQQHEAYPDIRPLTFKATPGQVFDAALEVARRMDWKIDASDTTGGRIEATSTTFWFGFKDDVVIRIHADTDGGTRLDIRSQSRVGSSDIGKNAERIRNFRRLLERQLGNA